MINLEIIKRLEAKKKLVKTERNDILLDIRNLHTYFPVYKGVFRRVSGWIKAVEGLTFNLKKGEILGIVGESGSGKSTIARSIVSLYKPKLGSIDYYKTVNIDHNQSINFKVDLLKLRRKELKLFRGALQMIFQDPYSSLNPRFTIFDIVREPLLLDKGIDKKDHERIVIDLLKKVGLSSEHLYRFPHEFSGGQRQRICIARALSTNPDLIVADEPVSALDVSIQAQIINLLKDLQKEINASYIFISHDLAVVRNLADRILIMYLGKCMETGPAEAIYKNPLHPYTNVLLSAVPDISKKNKSRIILKGEVPSILNKPKGCLFSPRCPVAKDICFKSEPDMREIDGTIVRCFFPGKL